MSYLMNRSKQFDSLTKPLFERGPAPEDATEDNSLAQNLIDKVDIKDIKDMRPAKKLLLTP